MKLLSLVLGIAMSASAFAKDFKIELEHVAYPSAAAIHLNITQSALAELAINKCGSVEKVLGVTDINLAITEGLNGSPDLVGKVELDPTNHATAINLWYPRIKASATVRCKD